MSTKEAPLDGMGDRQAFVCACALARIEPTLRQQRKWHKQEGAAWTKWKSLSKAQRKDELDRYRRFVA